MSAKKKTKKVSSTATALVPLEDVVRSIRHIRGDQVILDSDIAALYGVPTKALNQAVRRNAERFPDDFMFQLTRHEYDDLKSQIVTSNPGRGGRRTPPYAFTEEGVAMLSSVLRSERSIQVNIAIMRSFVAIRRALASEELFLQVRELERKYGRKFKDVFEALQEFRGLFQAIYLLLSPPAEPEKKRRIGFGVDDDE